MSDDLVVITEPAEPEIVIIQEEQAEVVIVDIGQKGDKGDETHAVGATLEPNDPDLILPQIWFTANIVSVSVYADSGTAQFTIKKNNIAIGDSFSVSSGHTLITNLDEYDLENEVEDYYSFHWESGTASRAIIIVAMESS
jgi:hypothetical protein